MEYRCGFAAFAGSPAGALPDGEILRPLSELSVEGGRRRGDELILDPSSSRRTAPPLELGLDGVEDIFRCEILSPELEAGFEAREAIPSWNTRTPEGTWVEADLAAKIAGRWTRWYELGVWASKGKPIKPRSSPGQGDEKGRLSTDTLILSAPAESFRLRLRLNAIVGAEPPSLRALSLAWSSAKPEKAAAEGASRPRLRGRIIEGVPAWSQMIYPDGGDVWCSPTSLSMVMAYWIAMRGEALPDEESFVRSTVAGVYDHEYEGHGNWSFNTAWAGERGFVASVRRYASLAGLEPWIGAGVPVIMSVSWSQEPGRTLSGAPVPKSRGHLTTLVGFDDSGDPVMNEPAAPDDATVRRVYRRSELEARWLEASGGTVYILYPERLPTPRPMPASSTKAR
jgi:hypothetical protein